MDGEDEYNPVKVTGTDDFILPIKRMLQGFGNEDPATKKKLPIEADIPEFLIKLAQHKKATAKDKRIGDLTLVAFYYLLRVGEYTSKYRTKSRAKKKRRRQSKKTVNFRVCDVTFFKRDSHGKLRQLPADAPKKDIMTADGATLRLMDQKNGWKNVCIHQQTNGHKSFCPVRALGRIILEIRGCTSSTTEWLSAFKAGEEVHHVTSKDISGALKFAATKLQYHKNRGIPIDRIDTHSLRAGGANALSLAGYKEYQIQKMGRWRGETFKEYISDQLSNFTDGMSKAMSNKFQFVNIAAGAMVDVTDSLAPSAAEAA